MKNKDLKYSKDIKYSDKGIAPKTLKSFKFSNRVFYITIILETITYIILAINIINNTALIVISILYLIVAIDLSFSQKKYSKKLMKETINKTIDPESFLNINLYNSKRKICNKRLYHESLNNIAYSYILLGKIDEAGDIIKYLDKMKKNLLLQSEIINNKIEIAFMKRDIKTFNKECNNLRKILRFIPRKRRKELKLNIDIKEAVINKDIQKVDDLSNLLEKEKKLFNKVMASYYKGLVRENKNKDKDTYKEYYEFVSENGNDIIIAKEIRKKMNINKKEYKYNRKPHIFYKLFQISVLLIFIASTIFWLMYLLYICSR